MVQEAIVLDLPAPPSVNRTRRVDWGFRAQLASWVRDADACVLMAKAKGVNPTGRRIERFELHITLSDKFVELDMDNALKTVIDYLCRIEVLVDDSKRRMRKLVAEWGDDVLGCRIEVIPL